MGTTGQRRGGQGSRVGGTRGHDCLSCPVGRSAASVPCLRCAYFLLSALHNTTPPSPCLCTHTPACQAASSPPPSCCWTCQPPLLQPPQTFRCGCRQNEARRLCGSGCGEQSLREKGAQLMACQLSGVCGCVVVVGPKASAQQDAPPGRGSSLVMPDPGEREEREAVRDTGRLLWPPPLGLCGGLELPLGGMMV